MNRFDWLELETPESVEGEPKGSGLSEEPVEGVEVLELAGDHYANADYDKALFHFSRAATLNPELQRAWFGQILCYLAMENYSMALMWVRKAKERFGQSARLLAAEALAEYRVRRDKPVAHLYNGIPDVKSADPFVLLVNGEIVIENDFDKAMELFDRAMELSGDDWQMPLWISEILCGAGKKRPGGYMLARARRMAPPHPSAHYRLGLLCERFRLIDDALDEYRTASEMNPAFRPAVVKVCELENMPLLQRLFYRIMNLWQKSIQC